MKKTELKSDCCGKPAIQTVDGRYFCGGIEGCGRYCKATPGGVPKEEDTYIGGVNLDTLISKQTVLDLITKEIATAHCKDSGGKTSRLTSLYMAITKL